MPQISWNEVRDRSIRFSREWSEATAEERDKQTFWNDFFDIFGIPRRSVATFEHAVANARGTYGFLDLFWPGILLVEHKSRGASFAKAESQAFTYINDLIRQDRHDVVPRYIILCDFARFALYDLEPDDQRDLPLFDNGQPYRLIEFPLAELHRYAREFAFIKGEKAIRLDPEDPANIKATQLLANLHDELLDTGYTGHALERYLVRLLFCLFAEDTAIFEPNSFQALVETSRPDGADLGRKLAELWDVLSTEQRQKTLDEDLASFPYVNGGLFAERLLTCSFNTRLREALLDCTRFHWARISPAVFGSLFQGILDSKARRQIGAHYTSERDIMKLLRGLFLDELRAELNAALADRSTGRDKRLREYQQKLRRQHLFDPACGCGNFLILAYRELRRLETEALVALHTKHGKIQTALDIRDLAIVDVDQFYGLEIGEWPVRIAEVGLWLQDHQCNVELAEALGQTFRRLPLRATPTIRVANALRTDWREFLPPTADTLILGNPPFVGAKYQTSEQRADMAEIAAGVKNHGLLDYVCGWYFKAADYMQGYPDICCAFVSTNSITQGEQVGVLWNHLFSDKYIKLHFAHRTFAWTSEARGKAHVHCVIIGFGLRNPREKYIFDYTADTAEPTILTVSNLSPYLTEGADHAIVNRSAPLCDVPEIGIGNKPIDGGNYLFTSQEKAAFLAIEPGAAPWFRRWIGSEEFINGVERWCLWLGDTPAAELRRLPECMKRVAAVRQFRLASKSAPTRKLADTPTRFHVENFPEKLFLVIPGVSSERRKYIPIGFIRPDVMASNLLNVVPNASLYHFGVLSSRMHMSWIRQICGRLKSDIRYSNTLVYNNFPWPEPTDVARDKIEKAAQDILDLRVEFGDGRLGFLAAKKAGTVKATLADLYDPLSMPPGLVKAHAKLDQAVERAYRSQPFESDRERVEHLFALYEQITAPLIPQTLAKKIRRAKSSNDS